MPFFWLEVEYTRFPVVLMYERRVWFDARTQVNPMNIFKALPIVAALIMGSIAFLDTSDVQAQQIIRESRTGGERVHKQAGKRTTTSSKKKKKGSSTVTTTRTTERRPVVAQRSTNTRTTTVRQTSRDRHDRHDRHDRSSHRSPSVAHRSVVTHPRHRVQYVHPRHHRSYRYVYSPRYQSYHDHHTSIVYVEVEREPELPELDCPIYTDSIVTDYETYCSTDRGTRHGPFVRYHTNGEVAEEGMYDYGTKEGTWVQYHTSGALKSEGEYHNGEREGLWVNFDSDGQEISRTIYR
jgi:hypothetical protein